MRARAAGGSARAAALVACWAVAWSHATLAARAARVVRGVARIAAQGARPRLDSKSGPVDGVWEAGGAVAAFRGVPFGADTSGANRFLPPQPVAPWSEPLDAASFGAGCQQRGSSKNPDVPANRSEDCLLLNVFTPTDALEGTRAGKEGEEGVPVMVWLHGGAYTEGSAFGPYDLYDGVHFVSTSGAVAVVSCNYRLGPLGFLAHQEAGVRGNAGLMDQIACLRWVNENAAVFGGDAARVTLWGESAGAQSLMLHMASENSKGLFWRGIGESTMAISLATVKEASHFGKKTSELLGCDKAKDVLACMQAADVEEVLSAGNHAQSDTITIMKALDLSSPTKSILPFRPVLDGEVLPSDQQPIELLLSGQAPNAVPALLGSNRDELWALIFNLPEWLKGLEIDAALGIIFGAETAVRARSFYNVTTQSEPEATIVAILTDYLFGCAAQRQLLALPAPSFAYRDEHLLSFGDRLFREFNLPQCAGEVCHMAELPLVFGNSAPSINVTLDADERAMSDGLIQAWVAFAAGDSPGWSAFDASNRTALVLGNKTAAAVPTIHSLAGRSCLEVWDKAGYTH